MNKRLQAILKLTRQVKNHNLVVPNYFGNLMRRIGGGERAVVRARQASPELIASRNSLIGAEMSHDIAAQRFKEAQLLEEALVRRSRKWKNPNSSRNQRRLQNASTQTKEAETRAITASLKSREAREAFNNTKKLATENAMRQVRNKGIKRTLAATGLIGGLGAGAFLVTPGDSDFDQASIVEETPQQYMYDPDGGWMEYNLEAGQYEALKPGFGIDRFGNTNYYDGTNWLSPDLYIQGSNGLIYDKATGQIIGNDDAMLAARNSGYNNIFDYRAALEGYDNPEYIKVLQLELGVTADGKWGRQTLDALNRKRALDYAKLYLPSNLFSIYQGTM